MKRDGEEGRKSCIEETEELPLRSSRLRLAPLRQPSEEDARSRSRALHERLQAAEAMLEQMSFERFVAVQVEKGATPWEEGEEEGKEDGEEERESR